MRRAARIDDNQPAIVAALRALGCFVQSLAALGGGVPDLLVLFRGAIYLMEVKDGSKELRKQRLTPEEAAWHAAATQYAPVHVVHSIDEAIAIVTGKTP